MQPDVTLERGRQSTNREVGTALTCRGALPCPRRRSFKASRGPRLTGLESRGNASVRSAELRARQNTNDVPRESRTLSRGANPSAALVRGKEPARRPHRVDRDDLRRHLCRREGPWRLVRDRETPSFARRMGSSARRTRASARTIVMEQGRAASRPHDHSTLPPSCWAARARRVNASLISRSNCESSALARVTSSGIPEPEYVWTRPSCRKTSVTPIPS